MTLAAYKVLHILGVVFLFTGLGALLATVWPGGQGGSVSPAVRKRSGLTHGLALLVILVSGFGMLAKIGVSPGGWELWIWLKIAIWLAIGAALAVARRRPGLAPALWFLLPLLGAAAAYLAIYKPA